MFTPSLQTITLKQKLKEMDHKIWYEKDDEIIHLEFTRDFLTADIPQIKEKVLELSEGKQYKQLLIKINKSGKMESRETREQMNKVLGEAHITDIAFVGISAAHRMIAKVLLKTGALKINGNFFKSMEDGINWIKSRR